VCCNIVTAIKLYAFVGSNCNNRTAYFDRLSENREIRAPSHKAGPLSVTSFHVSWKVTRSPTCVFYLIWNMFLRVGN